MATPPAVPPEESAGPGGARRRGCLGLLLAGLSTLGILSMAAMLSGPHTLAFVLLLGGTFGLIVLHYAAWGWWLGPQIREEAAREEAAARGEAVRDVAKNESAGEPSGPRRDMNDRT